MEITRYPRSLHTVKGFQGSLLRSLDFGFSCGIFRVRTPRLKRVPHYRGLYRASGASSLETKWKIKWKTYVGACMDSNVGPKTFSKIMVPDSLHECGIAY